MSELNAFSNPERWSVYVPRLDSFGVLDPITLRPFSPDTMPEWMEADPDLHEGLEYLRMYGYRTHVLVGYGSHGVAEDLGPLSDKTFEKYVERSNYFGFEGIGYTQSLLAKRRRVVADRICRSWQYEEDYSDRLEAYLRQHQEDGDAYSQFDARLEHAQQTRSFDSDTVSFSYDIAADGTPVERALYNAWQKVRELPTSTQSAIMQVGIHIVRECVAAAKTGLYIARGEQRWRTPRSVEVFETMGSAHTFYTHRLESLDVETRAWPIAYHLWRSKAISSLLPQIAKASAVLPEDLPVLYELHDCTRQT